MVSYHQIYDLVSCELTAKRPGLALSPTLTNQVWDYFTLLIILKMYLRAKNDVSRSRLLKVKSQSGQTDRCDHMHCHTTFEGSN